MKIAGKTISLQKLPLKKTPLMFGAGFAVIGVAMLVLTQAAAPSYSMEAENGSLLGSATVITDSTASGANGGEAILFSASATPTPSPSPTPGPVTCTTNATTSTFASAVSAATAGQTICLAAGNYGTFNGTDKAITITAQSGATVTMGFNLGTGDKDFTLDGLTIPGGSINGPGYTSTATNRPQNITIKNSTFTAAVVIDYLRDSNIVFDSNTHRNINNNALCTATPGRFHFPYDQSAPSGVTIKNSLMEGGNADGIQSGAGVTILNNTFRNIKENGGNDCAHSDPIQLFGPGHIVRGNYIVDSADGIVAYDRIASSLIEHNVIDLKTGRYGIELYSDNGSIVRFNTLIYGTGCEHGPCGQIILSRKTTDPAGVGTIIENNIATSISTDSGSTFAVNRNNMLRSGASGQNFNGTPVFVGGSSPTDFAGFLLAAGSPGKAAATDGSDVGIHAQ
jgi:hypothetical protein